MDLMKAQKLDKTKLVQVEVTVQGKHGTFTRKQWKSPGDVAPTDRVIGQSNTPSPKTPKFQLAELLSKIGRDKVMELAKERGVSWKENAHAGINWMRCSQAIQKHMGENPGVWGGTGSTKKPDGTTPKNDKTQSDQQTTGQTTGQKLSKEDAKKMTQSFTSKIGKTDAERKEFMKKVKAQGVTWKEKNDNGTEVSVAINWMRCCMALNKHFGNGGTFNTGNSRRSLFSKDKPTKDKPEKPLSLYSKDYSDATEYRKALAEKYNGITDVDKIKSDKDIADFANYTTQKDFQTATRLFGRDTGVRSTWDKRNGDVSVSSDSKGMSVLTIPKMHHPTTLPKEILRRLSGELSKIGITLTRQSDNQYLIERSEKKASSQPSPDGKTTGTYDHPFVTSETKSGRSYQVWMDNGNIYGSKPGINLNSPRNLREITDFTSQGFKDFDEVLDYIKKYF